MKVPWLSAAPPRLKRSLKWTAGVLLVYTITGFFILPPIIRTLKPNVVYSINTHMITQTTMPKMMP